ncbi:MAG: YkgJ family cysteine cluster protein [Desulfurococcaceae archaeon]
MGRIASKFGFIDFKNICSDCRVNCCRKYYAVLLPEEEPEFENVSFAINTEKGIVRGIGSYGGKPCPYLSENGFCKIYEKRPFDCRLWPVVVYIDLKTMEKVIYLDKECPAVIENRIPPSLINRIIEEVRKIDFDEKWLIKYTLAPWPNNFIEIARIRT